MTRPTRTAAVTSSSAAAASASTQSDIISLDLDEEKAGPSNRKDKKRKRGEAHPTVAPVGEVNEIVDLLDPEEERGTASAKKK